MGVVADINLPEPYVDTPVRLRIKSILQFVAGSGSCRESPWLASHIQRPRPGNTLASQVDAAFLKRDGIQHSGWHLGMVSGQLIGRWRDQRFIRRLRH